MRLADCRRREDALALLLGSEGDGTSIFEAGARAPALGLGYRWAAIGKIIDDGCSGQLLALLDTDHLADVFACDLVGNAIKFSGEAPPRVKINAERSDDSWLFRVQENGLGIEPQYADRIFQIFQRLHHPGEYSGTGIGLAVCKKIVERHRGRIRVESGPGKGSTFCFTLPAEGPRDD